MNYSVEARINEFVRENPVIIAVIGNSYYSGYAGYACFNVLIQVMNAPELWRRVRSLRIEERDVLIWDTMKIIERLYYDMEQSATYV